MRNAVGMATRAGGHTANTKVIKDGYKYVGAGVGGVVGLTQGLKLGSVIGLTFGNDMNEFMAINVATIGICTVIGAYIGYCGGKAAGELSNAKLEMEAAKNYCLNDQNEQFRLYTQYQK